MHEHAQVYVDWLEALVKTVPGKEGSWILFLMSEAET